MAHQITLIPGDGIGPEVAAATVRAVVETLCGGSMTPLLSHLAKAERLTEPERRALRELIDAPDDDDEADASVPSPIRR